MFNHLAKICPGIKNYSKDYFIICEALIGKNMRCSVTSYTIKDLKRILEIHDIIDGHSDFYLFQFHHCCSTFLEKALGKQFVGEIRCNSEIRVD